MAGFVWTAKHPISSITHHGLIKLTILQTLAQQNWTYEKFTGQVQEPVRLPSVPIEEEMEVHVLMGPIQNQEELVNP